MRVLHVISSLDPRAGGTVTALVALAHAQMDDGQSVAVASTFAEGYRADHVDRLRGLGMEVHLIGPNRRLLAYHRDIVPTLTPLVEGADIVHIHGLWEEIQHQAGRLARRFGKPYLVTPHGMLDPWSLAQSRLKKRIYMALRLRKNLARANALHFTDEQERALAERLELGTRSFVQRYLLDLREFDVLPQRGQFRDKYPTLVGRSMVLYLSRLHPKKGLDLLIPAFAKLTSKEAMLVLAGPVDDEYKAELMDAARGHGVVERVLFTGMLYGTDRVSAMADADVFVLPSYQENFGIVVIEALAAGTPVVISDQVNIHRQISEAKVGMVVPTQIDPLAAALERYLLDETVRLEAAGRARPYAQTTYDRGENTREWRKHYEGIVGRRS